MDNLHFGHVLIVIAIAAVTSLGGLAVVAAIFVRLPANYFELSRPRHSLVEHHPILRWTIRILKNIAGIVIIGAGILMSMPGIPGPGILTIVIGIMVLDFPGKLRLERWAVSRPRVTRAINHLRAKYGKPPLELG